MHTPAAQRWRPIVRQARQSGISIRAFARQHGLNPSTLAWWNWRLGPDDPPAESGFLEVVLAPERVRSLRLQVGRVHIEVDADTDLRLLRRVVEALA